MLAKIMAAFEKMGDLGSKIGQRVPIYRFGTDKAKDEA
jgi:hypothetical protein